MSLSIIIPSYSLRFILQGSVPWSVEELLGSNVSTHKENTKPKVRRRGDGSGSESQSRLSDHSAVVHPHFWTAPALSSVGPINDLMTGS